MKSTSTVHVSIIIPVYNQAQYLDTAIQSVLSQTYRDYEIIVVNDGSTDNTAEVACRYRDQIHYIFQENQGLAGARNTGIRAAVGNFIALLDSDDLWLEHYLERMIALTEENPQVCVYYCAAYCVNEEGSLMEQIVGYRDIKPTALFAQILRSNFIIPSTVLIRKAIIDQAACFDMSLRSCEDWDLWLRLLASGNFFVGCPDVLVKYRIHSKSLSANVSKMQSSYSSVVEKHFGLDDGLYDVWDEMKQFAYGGLYRYMLLTNIQRLGDWDHPQLLHKAILSDPFVGSDLDFFYELALGNQPVGYRGSDQQLELMKNAEKIEKLLVKLFHIEPVEYIQEHVHVICGTAFKAIGLAAYNTDQFALCRKYLIAAIKHQPVLLVKEKWILGNILKSFLGKSRKFFQKLLHRQRLVAQ